MAVLELTRRSIVDVTRLRAAAAGTPVEPLLAS
jgi:hypothetical protein